MNTYKEITTKLHSGQTVEFEYDNATITITPNYWDTKSNGDKVLVGVDIKESTNVAKMVWIPTFEINWLPARTMNNSQPDYNAQADYSDHMDTFNV